MQSEVLLDLSSLQPAPGVGGIGRAVEALSWEFAWGAADGVGACGEGTATEHAVQPNGATTEEERESRKKAALAVLFAAIPNPAEPSLPVVPPETSLRRFANPAPATGGTQEREETGGGNVVVSTLGDGQHDASPDTTAFFAEPMLLAPERAEGKISLDGQPEARSDWQPRAVTAPETDPLTPLASEKRGEAWPGRTVADVLLRPSGDADPAKQAIPQTEGEDPPGSRVPAGSRLMGVGQLDPEPATVPAPLAAGGRIDGAGGSKPSAGMRNGDAVPGVDRGDPEAIKSDPEQGSHGRLARPVHSDSGGEAPGRSEPGSVEEESDARFRPRPEDAAQETGPGTESGFSSASVFNPLRRMDQNIEPETRSTPGAGTLRPAVTEIEPRSSAIRPDGQIDLQIDGQAGERVRIRFAEAPGGIRVRIASNDARLAESLRSGWASLEAALRQAGWEQKDPVSAVAEEAGNATASVRSGHGGADSRAGLRLGDEGRASVPPPTSQSASQDKPGDGRSGQGRPDTENQTREEWLDLSALRRLARRRQG